MSAIAAALKHMLAAGMAHDRILAAVEEMENALTSAPAKSSGALRTQRWREKRASQNVTEPSPRDAEADRHQTSQTVTEASPRDVPRAHVRDINSTSENNLLTAAVVVTSAQADDWPDGGTKVHLAQLIELASSHRLDLGKTPGLVTTAGRLVAWRRDGASWEHDVVPAVTTSANKRGPPIQSWKFFDAAIAQSIADNRRALTIPEARRHDGPDHNAKRTARDDRLSRMLAGAVEAADGDEAPLPSGRRIGGG